MPTYTYVARDYQGDRSEGKIQASTETEMRQTLRARGLFVVECTNASHTFAAPAQPNPFKRRAKLSDMVVMSRQLATLVRAGLPIVEALHTTAEQTESTILATALRQVRLDVVAGLTLTQAMRAHPNVFPPLYVALVDAGENSGTLEAVLDVAAKQFDQEAELREKVKAAMTYPILVVVAACAVIAVMLLMVVPVFARVYTSFGHELPWVTQALIAVSSFSVRWWWIVVLGIIAIVLGVRQYGRRAAGRRHIDSFKLRIPVFGKLLRKISTARFAETLAAVIGGGIPILKGLTVSANTCGNVVLEDAILGVRDRVKDGATLSTPLAETGQFPPLVVRMVAAGERSGNLEEMLAELNRFYQRDIDYSVQRLTKLMEPVMTVLVGGIVLFTLLALYMPIFSLTTVIRR